MLSNLKKPSYTSTGWGKSVRTDDQWELYLSLYNYRPRFLQYNYMYDYRLNYYDDVIDYLDKKDRGIKSEIPKPQTWAERVLRTVKEYVVKEQIQPDDFINFFHILQQTTFIFLWSLRGGTSDQAQW